MDGRGGRQVVQFTVDGRPALFRGRQVVTLAGVRVAAAAVVVRTRAAARHALRVLPVQVQREHACRAAERTGPGARAARPVAGLAKLRGRVVVLRARALGAQAVLEHEVRRTRRALQRAFTCNRHMYTLCTIIHKYTAVESSTVVHV